MMITITNVLQIADGRIPGVHSIVANLTTEQCYKIAKSAHTSKHYTLAVEWFDTVKEKLSTDPLKDTYSFTTSNVDEAILETITEVCSMLH